MCKEWLTSRSITVIRSKAPEAGGALLLVVLLPKERHDGVLAE